MFVFPILKEKTNCFNPQTKTLAKSELCFNDAGFLGGSFG